MEFFSSAVTMDPQLLKLRTCFDQFKKTTAETTDLFRPVQKPQLLKLHAFGDK